MRTSENWHPHPCWPEFVYYKNHRVSSFLRLIEDYIVTVRQTLTWNTSLHNQGTTHTNSDTHVLYLYQCNVP